MAHDLLKEASHALRVEHDGESQTATQTRARVLLELAKTRKRRRPRWLFLLPPGALIATSTALAATGQLDLVVERARQAVEWVLSGHESASADNVKTRSASNAATTQLEPREVVPAVDEEPAPVLSESGPKQSEPDAPELEQANPTAQHRAPALVESVGKSSEGSAASRDGQEHEVPRSTDEGEPAVSVSPELLAYEEAHQLHFAKGDCRAAVAAWDRYLRLAPTGSLAPEARYNRALCWVELGERAKAIEALSAMASGKHGSYRKAEARSLLEALKQE